MTRTSRRAALAALCTLALSGCPRTDLEKSLGPIGSMQRPMVCTSGQCATDTNTAHAAVVYITIMSGGGGGTCSGTLVAPNVVVTAGHCVSTEAGVAITSPSSYGVYFGTDCSACIYGGCSCTYKAVTGVHRHPAYDGDGYYGAPLNDVAVLNLASTPTGVVAIPVLPGSLASNIKSGVSVEFSGFGQDNNGNTGVKLRATNTLGGVCNSGTGCTDYSPWTIYYDQNPGGPCNGDSGGPTFWKDSTGKEYVIGATSYGDQNCAIYGTSTFLSHFAGGGDNFLNPYLGASYSNGHTCSTSMDCLSGNCVSGICCNQPCTAACYTCSTGTCAALVNTACNDNNPCTVNDLCNGGSCSGSIKDCGTTSGGGCTVGGTCNLSTGICDGAGPRPNGTACEDGNPCTQGDTCQSGACTAGAASNSCPAPDSCHDGSACNVSTGKCDPFPQKPNGTSCDDANPCTGGDSCLAGTCLPSTRVSCPAPDACHEAGTCSASTGKCPSSYPAKPNGTSCNDGNACTTNDACAAGVCKGAASSSACPADQCHAAGTCSAATGLCSGSNKADGTSCNDADSQTENDTCTAGICKGRPIGLDPCYGAPAATDCDDKNACTRDDFCLANVCTGTNPKPCTTPPDDCHEKSGTCDWQNGNCVYKAIKNGLACDDGDDTTTDDHCETGRCIGTPVSNAECDGQPDGTTCTDGSCKDGACVATGPGPTAPAGSCGCGSTGASAAPSALLMGLAAAAMLRRRLRR